MNSTETASTNQYLTFMLGEETFAANVIYIREVLEVLPITKVPRTPKFILGVVNVRGNVVPVIDMRLKFDMAAPETTADSAIIVIEIYFDDEPVTVGALVDAVNEVLEIEKDKIEKPPRIGMRISNEIIEGIGKREDEFIIILNMNRLFAPDELAIAQKDNRDKETNERFS